MRHELTRRRAVLVSLLVVAAVLIGGAANAYWRGSGGGTGSAATGTMLAVTLTPGTATAGLYPGGTTSVVLTVTSSNSSSARLGSLALDTTQGTGGFAVDGGHSACAVSALSFTTQTNGGAGWTVPAKVGAVNGSLSITMTTALAMGVSAANACQGATFTVYLTAGP